MSDYERLREALEAIVGSYPETTEPSELSGWIGMVRSIANNALGDTSKDSEMQQLVVWLSAESNKEAVKRSPDYQQALLYVLDYIYGEFGYE